MLMLVLFFHASSPEYLPSFFPCAALSLFPGVARTTWHRCCYCCWPSRYRVPNPTALPLARPFSLLILLLLHRSLLLPPRLCPLLVLGLLLLHTQQQLQQQLHALFPGSPGLLRQFHQLRINGCHLCLAPASSRVVCACLRPRVPVAARRSRLRPRPRPLTSWYNHDRDIA